MANIARNALQRNPPASLNQTENSVLPARENRWHSEGPINPSQNSKGVVGAFHKVNPAAADVSVRTSPSFGDCRAVEPWPSGG